MKAATGFLVPPDQDYLEAMPTANDGSVRGPGPARDLAVINATVTKLPEWMRVDLSAMDQTARHRAEETLAAMIAAALVTHER